MTYLWALLTARWAAYIAWSSLHVLQQESGNMQMIPVMCPACGGHYNVPATLAGKQAKCTKCGGLLTIPTPGAAQAGDSQGPLVDENVAFLAQLQSAQKESHERMAQQPPSAQPTSPYAAYAAPQSFGTYHQADRSRGLPGVLIAMCVTVFVLTGLGLFFQVISLLMPDEPETIQLGPQKRQAQGNVEAKRVGQTIGTGIDCLLSIGKIAGAILLLRRKAVGRTLLKVCTIISLVFLILAGTCLLFAMGMLTTMAGEAPFAVVFVVALLVLGGCGAYYWFILSTLARDDVKAALE
jgi:ribosomal protein S27E